MNPLLHEFTSGVNAALVDAAAEQIAEQIERAIAQRGEAFIAVSGGKSPEALFERLAGFLLPWRRVHITLVDERFVPPTHPDSNESLVRRCLLKGRAADAQFVPLYHAGVSIEKAAELAEQQLRQWSLPFDVVLLGMGDDGHTASWFPDAPELPALLDSQNNRLVAVAHPQRAPHPRLTLTRAAVLNSRLIQLLIPGDNKRPVFQQAKTEAEPLLALPVRAVLHQSKVPVHAYRS